MLMPAYRVSFGSPSPLGSTVHCGPMKALRIVGLSFQALPPTQTEGDAVGWAQSAMCRAPTDHWKGCWSRRIWGWSNPAGSSSGRCSAGCGFCWRSRRLPRAHTKRAPAKPPTDRRASPICSTSFPSSLVAHLDDWALHGRYDVVSLLSSL